MTHVAGRFRTATRHVWGRVPRIAVVIVATSAVVCFAFAYRFNALGGARGGIDNDHFARLMRTDALLQGEQPLRDFVDAELRGAWPALDYAVPAWAQMIGGQTFLPEAYLTTGALAVAYAIVFLLALEFSKRWTVAIAAVAAALFAAPRLYNYPKVLMLACGALAIRAAMSNPSALRLGLMGVVTAVATLFRHDYGVYLAVGMIAALVARDLGRSTRNIAIYCAATAACLAPSAFWVQRYEGIPAYLANVLASSGLESARTELRLPVFDPSSIFSGDGVLLLTYYLYWAVPLVGAGLLALRWKTAGAPRLGPAERATAIGLLALAVVVNALFLRANLGQRFGDAAVPVVLLLAWGVGAASELTPRRVRAVAMSVPVVLLLSILVSTYTFGDVSGKLRDAGLSDSWEETSRRFQTARADLARLPPMIWPQGDLEGTLPVSRYVAECTRPADRVFVADYAPEVLVFAKRLFAGGQSTVSLSFYKSEADQRRTLARLEQQSVPIIIADAREFEEGFVDDYPLLAQHLAEHYREAGTIAVEEEPRFLVFVEANRPSSGMDPYFGLPCFQ